MTVFLLGMMRENNYASASFNHNKHRTAAIEMTYKKRIGKNAGHRARNSSASFWKRIFRRPAKILAGAIAAGIVAGLASLYSPDLFDIPDDNAITSEDNITQRFTLCQKQHDDNCVVDGDTIRMNGKRIRIADIDTPETHPPRCADEARKGNQATERMLELLNQGPFSLEQNGSRSEDRYGRQLRIVTRKGVSLGDILVDEGLARPWEGRRRSWC